MSCNSEFGLGKRCTPAGKQATRSVCAGERVRVKGFYCPFSPYPFALHRQVLKVIPLPCVSASLHEQLLTSHESGP
ncbi:hypothetical protein FDUTEX481_06716 [Tolypothrix sp. PCC 7601]|nr:hypothetical protein FDUTEX481_06716 [Tolypothrix sp. PCC 7601]